MEKSFRLQAPAALPTGKESQYPLNRRLGEPQSRSGRLAEEAALLNQLGFELRIVQPVA
jgi:hypothetical protein